MCESFSILHPSHSPLHLRSVLLQFLANPQDRDVMGDQGKKMVSGPQILQEDGCLVTLSLQDITSPGPAEEFPPRAQFC